MVQTRKSGRLFFLLEKNSPDSSSLMFHSMRADALPDLTDVSGKMAQMIQFLS